MLVSTTDSGWGNGDGWVSYQLTAGAYAGDYVYGHVAGADHRLRAQLAHGQATLTPAERASRPHLAHLSITAAGPPVSVVAVALVNVAPGPPSPLTATLEPRRGKWLVVAITG